MQPPLNNMPEHAAEKIYDFIFLIVCVCVCTRVRARARETKII